MSKTFGLQTSKQVWETAGDPTSVASRVIEAAEHLGGSIQSRSNEKVDMRFGSKFNYRMLGVWSKPEKRPLILRFTVEPTGATTAKVRAEAFSDPGWYAFPALTSSLAERHYAESFRRLYDGIQASVPPVQET